MTVINTTTPEYKVISHNEYSILQLSHTGIGDNTAGFYHFRLPINNLIALFDKRLYYHIIRTSLYTSDNTNPTVYISVPNKNFNLIQYQFYLDIDHSNGYSFKSFIPPYLLGKLLRQTCTYIQLSFQQNTNLADYSITLDLIGSPRQQIEDIEYYIQ